MSSSNFFPTERYPLSIIWLHAIVISVCDLCTLFTGKTNKQTKTK